MKKIKITLIFLFVIVFSVSCEKEDFSYNGPDYVEFKPTSGSGSNQYLNARYYFHNYNLAPAIGNNTYTVQLIGPQRDADITVNYVIRDFVYYDIARNMITGTQPAGDENINWLKINSTATAGINYNSSGSGSFTIPANSSFGTFQIEVLTNNDNTNTKNSKMVFIELIDNGFIKANAPTSILMICFGKRNSSNPTIF